MNNSIDIINGVPKVGDRDGVNLLIQIKNKQCGYLSEILNSSTTISDISIKTTAYNWLPVELKPKERNTAGKNNWKVISSKVSVPMVYALLNSRVVYWLWKVWGDGFSHYQ